MAERIDTAMGATTYQPEGAAPITLTAPAKAAAGRTLSPHDPPVPGSPKQGLSEAEAAARRARGQGNEFHPQTSRSYLQIVRQHAFSFINSILFAIGIALV